MNALSEVERRGPTRDLAGHRQPVRKTKRAVSRPHSDREIVAAAYFLSDRGRRISRATIRHQGVKAPDAAIDNVIGMLADRKLIDRSLVAGEPPEPTVDLKGNCRRLVGEYRRATAWWREGGGA